LSRKFRSEPITVVIGSKPKMGPDPEWIKKRAEEGPTLTEAELNARAPVVQLAGAPEPLKTAAGRYVGSRVIRSVPLFEGGRVVGVLTAWVNEAAKRRNKGVFKDAKPTDVVLIPLYRGAPASVYNRLKAAAKRRVQKQAIEVQHAEAAS
jgi:hypothetical protein